MIRIAIIEDDDDMMRIVSKCVKESSMGVAEWDRVGKNGQREISRTVLSIFDIPFRIRRRKLYN